MLSTKHAKMAITILLLCLAAAFSFFFAAEIVAESDFVKEAVESVEESSNTVMRFSAATLATSLAITALPDDFATPLADSLADMNVYFVAILVVLFLEKILILYGVKMAFAIAVPVACAIGILAVLLKRDLLKGLATRLCILALAVALVVPSSTYITDIVAADLTDYVNETIEETNEGAGKLNEAMTGGAEDKTMFEKLSDLFQTAIRDVSDLMLHFQNTIRRCMNSVAIMILTNCIMPVLTFFVLKWILKETFHVVIPVPELRRRRKEKTEPGAELVAVGEESHEE